MYKENTGSKFMRQKKMSIERTEPISSLLKLRAD
jgi:hypothetical protein